VTGPLRLGIDDTGTGTVAALLDAAGQVLAWHRADGVPATLAGVLAGIPGAAVGQVMLATARPGEALARQDGLARVGVLRIAAPATTAVPPLAGWPPELAARVGAVVRVIRGGHRYQGEELVPLEVAEVRRFARDCRGAVDAVAVTAVSSPTNPDHERRAADLLAAELGTAVPVVQGHQLAGLGLLERENAAVLAAALAPPTAALVADTQAALRRHRVRAELYLCQHDGTLLTAAEAVRRPVLTAAAGPAGAVRGAAHLTGCADAVVVDLGERALHVGLLAAGRPAESAGYLRLGGVRTSYRAARSVTAALGAASAVRTEPLSIGPDAAGPSLVEVLDGGGRRAAAVRALLAGQVERLVEAVRASRAELPVIAVGAAARLVPDRPLLPDRPRGVLRPEHGAVAGAVGAAVAPASGSVDRTFRYGEHGRDACLDEARELARLAAVRAGANALTVRITALTELPPHHPGGGCVRVRVTATGPPLVGAGG
jgi:N-methylhydantoinase A/oxoprolinase/acetone carboxylase beta subunit